MLLKKSTQAARAISLVLALAAPFAGASVAMAEDGTYKGRGNAVGNTCRNNTWFEIEASITGQKVEGSLLGSAFQRGPTKFSGEATDTTFSASIVYAALNNLKVDVSGVRVDDQTWTISTKWAGGGPSNCESTGPAKKI